ncbi:MAG TPA: DUF4179 domain-containing protein [Bacillales bacterium]|nr:DUF4179 domain-containing protein [Bacillales bacterium]
MKRLFLLSTYCMILISYMVSTPPMIQAEKKEQPINIEKSVTDKDITFTINHYEKKDGKLTIYYTVTSEQSVLKENKIGYQFMDRPHFYINQKHLNVSFRENQSKINDHKFTGFVSLDLENLKSEHYNFTITTDRIAEQVGIWKLSINI